MEKMYEVGFEIIDDGTVKLDQQSGVEEPNVIWIHPEQLRFITRRLCGLNEATASQVQDLERKLSVLTDRLERLVTAKWFRDGIINDCGDFAEMLSKLDGLVDLAIEMDGGRLLPSEPKPEPKKPSKYPTPKPPANHQQLDLPS